MEKKKSFFFNPFNTSKDVAHGAADASKHHENRNLKRKKF
jgi:hypothetical protein